MPNPIYGALRPLAFAFAEFPDPASFAHGTTIAASDQNFDEYSNGTGAWVKKGGGGPTPPPFGSVTVNVPCGSAPAPDDGSGPLAGAVSSTGGDPAVPVPVPAGATSAFVSVIAIAAKGLFGIVFPGPPIWHKSGGGQTTPNADGSFPVVGATTCSINQVTVSLYDFANASASALTGGELVVTYRIDFY